MPDLGWAARNKLALAALAFLWRSRILYGRQPPHWQILVAGFIFRYEAVLKEFQHKHAYDLGQRLIIQMGHYGDEAAESFSGPDYCRC